MFTGCSDDLLDANGSASSNPDEDGSALEFTLSLGSFGNSTRSGWTDNVFGAGTLDENYIHPDNFHIILYNKEGYYLKEWTDLSLRKMATGTSENSYKWRVRLPYSEIKDVMTVLKDEGFKIAVLANWERYPDFSATPMAYDENGVDRNDIFYMTHCLKDESYMGGSSDDLGYLENDIFQFITGSVDNPKMALTQDWVRTCYPTDEAVEEAIRKNYKFDKKDVARSYFHSPESGYDYYDSWKIWNFGGDNNKGFADKFYISTEDDTRNTWAEINDDWYKEVFCRANGTDEDDLTLQNTGEKGDNSWFAPRNISNLPSVSHRGLDLVVVGNNLADNKLANGAKKPVGDSFMYGVNLRSYTTNTGNIQMNQEGTYFHFMVPADGYVRVKCETINPKETADTYIVARRGLTNSTASVKTQAEKLTPGQVNEIKFSFDNKDGQNETVRVTHQPLDFCLYAAGGNLRIYEIEYIKSHNIQLADRVGIDVSETNNKTGGISMYGIQDFEPLGEYWPEGTIFNLSDGSGNSGLNADKYSYRPISLIRSVAKCEVWLPKNLFPEPSHVIMRTMNRYARSAPLDVFTPTDLLWYGWHYNDIWGNLESRSNVTTTINYGSKVGNTGRYTHNYERVVDIDTEYERIRNNGLMFVDYPDNYFQKNPGESDADYNQRVAQLKFKEYREKFSWLYGLWNIEYGWNWGGDTEFVFNNTSDSRYPRVFNTRIARSDYAHFIEGQHDQQYWKYYIYIPEKNVTDPNNKGDLSERPKLQHVEIRFDGRNGDRNMDDDACYRLYFAEGGKIQGFPSRGQYDNMENNTTKEQLQQTYPIMRNHIYRFVVNGISMNGLNVDFKVRKAEERSVTYEFE